MSITDMSAYGINIMMYRQVYSAGGGMYVLPMPHDIYGHIPPIDILCALPAVHYRYDRRSNAWQYDSQCIDETEVLERLIRYAKGTGKSAAGIWGNRALETAKTLFEYVPNPAVRACIRKDRSRRTRGIDGFAVFLKSTGMWKSEWENYTVFVQWVRTTGCRLLGRFYDRLHELGYVVKKCARIRGVAGVFANVIEGAVFFVPKKYSRKKPMKNCVIPPADVHASGTQTDGLLRYLAFIRALGIDHGV